MHTHQKIFNNEWAKLQERNKWVEYFDKKDNQTIFEKHRHYFYPQIPYEEKLSQGNDLNSFGEKMKDRLNNYLLRKLYNIPEPTPHIEDVIMSNLKYAKITANDKYFVTFVDNISMKAYVMFDNDYFKGLVYPLQEIKEYIFHHWCSGLEI